MSLNINKVHVLQRDATGRDILQKSNPYARFVSSDGGAMSVQGGRFYSDGEKQPVIPFKDVPGWVWKAVRAMTPEGRANVGLVLPEERDPNYVEPPENEPEEDSAQPSGEPSEAPKTLVDYVYELQGAVDAHWTKAGLPDLNALKEALGRYVTRGEVEAACPDYRRPSQEPEGE